MISNCSVLLRSVPLPDVVSSSPCGSSCCWGPPGPRSSCSIFRSRFSPSAQI
jgi:hypothetical protein